MKTRIAQPTAPLLCPATRVTIEALVAIRTPQADQTEKDHHWKALKCLLAYPPVTSPNPPLTSNAQTGHSES